VAIFSRKPAIHLKWGKSGPRLLLTTNRKLHTRFRLVPNQRSWMTYKRPLLILHNNMYFSEPNMKINSHYQRQRCSLMTGFWQYKLYPDIRGVPWRVGIKRQWGNQKCLFSAFKCYYIFGTLGNNKANISLSYYLFRPSSPLCYRHHSLTIMLFHLQYSHVT